MMKRSLTIGAVLLLAGTLAVPVFAWGPGRWSGRGAAGPGACWNEGGTVGPTLNEEQQARVDALVRGHDEEAGPIRAQLRAKRAQQQALLAGETVDEAQVKALQKEINGLRDRLSDKRTDLLLALKKVDPSLRSAGPVGPGGKKGAEYGWGRGRHRMGGGYGPGYGPGSCW